MTDHTNTIQSWEDPRYFIPLEFAESRNLIELELVPIPNYHDCLLGEIRTGGVVGDRLNLGCRGATGLDFVVKFEAHHWIESFEQFPPIDVGNTIAILYPNSYEDYGEPICVEVLCLDETMIMPLNLDQVFTMNREVIKFVNRDGTPRKCHACGKADTQLFQCGRCKLFGYCNRDCQVKAWEEHKKFCNVLKNENVRLLTLLDFGDVSNGPVRFN